MAKLAALLGSVAIVASLALGAVFWFTATPRECSGSAIAGGAAAIGGPFTLVNHRSETVTDTDVINGPTLIYFGFTYCPDVCPLDVARNAEAIDILKENNVEITPVFITIDPARDTPEVLADYVENLHDKMIGLTGTPEQIDAASKAYKTYYRKNGEGEDYLMDHSTFTYLMNESGLLEFFRRDVSPEEMAETVACFAAQS